MTIKQIKKELNEIAEYTSSEFCTDWQMQQAEEAEKKLLKLLIKRKDKENMKNTTLFITNLIILSLLVALITAFIVRTKQDIEQLSQNTQEAQRRSDIEMYNLGYRMGLGYSLSCHE